MEQRNVRWDKKRIKISSQNSRLEGIREEQGRHKTNKRVRMKKWFIWMRR